MSITTDAQDLYEQYNVAQLRELIKAENEDNVPAPSKLRKHELAQYLADIRHNKAQAEEADNAPLPVGNAPMVEHHPAHAAALAVQVGGALARQTEAYTAAELVQLEREAITRAWRDRPVQVTSMGSAVRGHVVGATLRPYRGRGNKGYTGYEVLLTVAHDGHATRRTLHAFSDIKLLAS